MKKLTLLFLLISSVVFGQTWQQVGNTLQRKIVGQDTTYRINMGSPGFTELYTKGQLDSRFSKLSGSNFTGPVNVASSAKLSSFHRTTSQPSFSEYWYDDSANGTSKVSIGMLGSPEANVSFNMDYSDGTHKYYDTTKNAAWEYLNPFGWGIQFMRHGFPQTPDPWYAHGGRLVWAVPYLDSLGDTKGGELNTLRLRLRNFGDSDDDDSSSLIVSQQTGNTYFIGSNSYVFDSDLQVNGPIRDVNGEGLVETIQDSIIRVGSSGAVNKRQLVLFSGNNATAMLDTLSNTNILHNLNVAGSLNAATTATISGVLYANAVNGNIKLKSDGSDEKDGTLYAGSDGSLNLTNWAGTRGLKIKENGNIDYISDKSSFYNSRSIIDKSYADATYASQTTGSWTPTNAAISTASGSYIKTGKEVTAYFEIVFSASASGSPLALGGLPFSNNSSSKGIMTLGYSNLGTFTGELGVSSTTMFFYKTDGSSLLLSDISGKTIRGMVTCYTN